MVATRSAVDRVFGIVPRVTSSSGGSFKDGGGKPKGSSKYGRGAYSSKSTDHTSAEDVEECEAFMFEEFHECHARSTEDSWGACGAEDFDWSSDAFGEEFCFAESGEFSSEGCTAGDIKDWARQFKQAHESVWPSREACLAECTEECAADMKEARAEALEFAKSIIEKMFGKDAEVEYLFGEENEEDEEEVAFCQDVCGGVCEDFGRPSWARGPSPDAEPRFEMPTTPSSSKTAKNDQDEQIAAKIAARLRDALDRASSKIRDAAPGLMAHTMPELPGFYGGLLGDSPTEHLSFGGFDEEWSWDSGESALLEGVGLGAYDFPTALHGDEVWLDEPGAVWADAPDAHVPDFSGGVFPVHASIDRFPDGASGLPLASHISSMGLVPSRASLFDGIPKAAQWAAGSPPFLDRLLRRASSRLGIASKSSVEMMR